jgi:mono/diheme cytochrome c family protein
VAEKVAYNPMPVLLTSGKGGFMLKSLPLLFAGIALALVPAAVSAPRADGQQTPSAQPPAPAAAATPVNYPKNPIRPTADSQAKAKNFYQIDCAMCHGDNGNGKSDLATSMGLTLNDWTDPKSLAGKPDGEIFNMIRNGKDKMPPEDPSRAKDDDVWNLVIYIRSFSKSATAAASTAAK